MARMRFYITITVTELRVIRTSYACHLISVDVFRTIAHSIHRMHYLCLAKLHQRGEAYNLLRDAETGFVRGVSAGRPTVNTARRCF